MILTSQSLQSHLVDHITSLRRAVLRLIYLKEYSNWFYLYLAYSHLISSQPSLLSCLEIFLWFIAFLNPIFTHLESQQTNHFLSRRFYCLFHLFGLHCENQMLFFDWMNCFFSLFLWWNCAVNLSCLLILFSIFSNFSKCSF